MSRDTDRVKIGICWVCSVHKCSGWWGWLRLPPCRGIFYHFCSNWSEPSEAGMAVICSDYFNLQPGDSYLLSVPLSCRKSNSGQTKEGKILKVGHLKQLHARIGREQNSLFTLLGSNFALDLYLYTAAILLWNKRAKLLELVWAGWAHSCNKTSLFIGPRCPWGPIYGSACL